MHTDINSTASTLARNAHTLGWVSRLLAVLLPVLLSVSWFVGTAKLELLRNLGLDTSLQLEPMQILGAFLLSLLPVLALARALFNIATCFDCFVKTDWFGSMQPLALAKAGRWLVVSGLLVLSVPTLLGLIVTFNASIGERALVISLSSNGALSILFGVLLSSFGQLWAKANALASENARFV
ncbi:MAG: hypothetical protein ABJ327_03555 [Litoreibacter sp.]